MTVDSIIRSASNNPLNTLRVEELKRFIATAGKRANQRIVELEKQGRENVIAYRYLTSKMRERDKLLSRSESGHLKFDKTTRGLTRNELLRKANEIRGFLKAKTSTIKGIEKSYAKALDTFNKNAGVNLTRSEFDKLVTASTFESYKARFGSEQFVKLIQEQPVEIASEVLQANVQTIREQTALIKKIKAREGFEKMSSEELRMVDDIFED